MARWRGVSRKGRVPIFVPRSSVAPFFLHAKRRVRAEKQELRDAEKRCRGAEQLDLRAMNKRSKGGGAEIEIKEIRSR